MDLLIKFKIWKRCRVLVCFCISFCFCFCNCNYICICISMFLYVCVCVCVCYMHLCVWERRMEGDTVSTVTVCPLSPLAAFSLVFQHVLMIE